MTEAERLNSFRAAVRAATEHYGVRAVSTFQVENLGIAALVKPGPVQLELIPEWTAQEAETTNDRTKHPS